jgi:hypothetical protein
MSKSQTSFVFLLSRLLRMFTLVLNINKPNTFNIHSFILIIKIIKKNLRRCLLFKLQTHHPPQPAHRFPQNFPRTAGTSVRDADRNPVPDSNG